MDSGLVTSLSGAVAQSKRLEKIANNLANADTPGFKSEDLVLQEAYIASHQNDTRSDIPERPYTENELLSKTGEEQRPVLYGEDFTDMRSGGIKKTSHTLDFAIEGNGFFEVLTPQGVRLTRAGNFNLDEAGRLVTHEGYLVLSPGQATSPEQAAGRAINVGSNTITVDVNGVVYGQPVGGEDGPVLGQLSVVQVENPRSMKKLGNNLYEAGEDAGLKPAGQVAAAVRGPAGELNTKPNPLGATNQAPRIRQGMLETSNVNPVQEMSKMIQAQRLFEQNVKLMQTFGEMSSRASELGKF